MVRKIPSILPQPRSAFSRRWILSRRETCIAGHDVGDGLGLARQSHPGGFYVAWARGILGGRCADRRNGDSERNELLQPRTTLLQDGQSLLRPNYHLASWMRFRIEGQYSFSTQW